MVLNELLITQTMYQSDYNIWDLKPKPKIPPQIIAKAVKKSNYRPKQMDLEIMQPFKTEVNVPFSLLHRKKKIYQINPHAPIPKVKLEDKMFELKLKARQERPVVYMVPQISLDRIPEDVMYGDKGKGGLFSSIYSSHWKKACQFAIDNSPLKPKGEHIKQEFSKKDVVDKSIEKTRANFSSVVSPMEVGLAKYVPEWEKLNPVEYVDTTKLFWKSNYSTALCSICDPQPATHGLTDEEKAELESCLTEDALTTPFTLHPPGYTGYVPNLALGIPFRKKKFTKYDPYVTTLMEAQGAYAAYKN